MARRPLTQLAIFYDRTSDEELDRHEVEHGTWETDDFLWELKNELRSQGYAPFVRFEDPPRT